MKIKYKLIFGFATVIALISVAGLVYAFKSQEVLQRSIGGDSATLASQTVNDIDRGIYYRAERWKAYCTTNSRLKETLLSSNQEFKRLADIQAYIDKKDKEWTSVPFVKITPFMAQLINNTLSGQLRERMDFYEGKYGYKVFGEVFVTNRYGANVAQTGKTTDYYQADEEWWQKAKQDGLYIADVEYDRSAGVYSTDICIRIDDANGNFQGVMKAVLNIEEAINILKGFERSEALRGHKREQFKLITKDGRLIYSTEKFEIFEKMAEELFAAFKGETGYFITNKPEEEERLIAYAQAKGYRDFKGLGWIVTVEHETREAFAPISELMRMLVVFTGGVTALAIFISLLISDSISRSIAKLMEVVGEFSKGNLGVRAKVKSRDEVGELAQAFNQMATDLKKSQEKLKKYSKNLEEEVKKRTKELDQEIKESEKAKLAALNILEDVDKTKEELDRAYRELQSLEMMKGEFMNIAAHELKTPLQPIIGYTDRLLKQGNLNNWQKERLNIILDNAKNLFKLVQDILDINKMETGIMRFAMEEIDLIKIIKEIHQSFQPVVEAKKLKFVLEIPKTAGAIKMKGDSTRLTQVFSNLIDNAVKFTDQGSITIKVSENAKSATISVKDTGTGIAKKHMPQVFTKFFQVDATDKRKVSGTGLGLAICKEIVKAHQGKISAQSTPGKGSTFIVVLPKLTKSTKGKEVENG